jgi:hypothetical protein
LNGKLGKLVSLFFLFFIPKIQAPRFYTFSIQNSFVEKVGNCKVTKLWGAMAMWLGFFAAGKMKVGI